MIDLLDELNKDSEITYIKCGEIVVAPKCNVFALFCIYCEDIFVHVNEFIRHARRFHNNELDFCNRREEPTDIYTIEELMNGMSHTEIIANEELEWVRRKHGNIVLQNEFIDFKLGIETTDEFSDMDYSEDERNYVVLGKVNEPQSKEVDIINKLESENCHSEKSYYSEEKNDPDLDDLLNELDNDLDGSDINIIKTLSHKSNNFMLETKSKNKKIGKFVSFSQHEPANIVDNNSMKSGIKNLAHTTEVSNLYKGQNVGSVDEWSPCSYTFNARVASEAQLNILKKNKQIDFRSEHNNIQVNTEVPCRQTFHKIDENSQPISSKQISNKIYKNDELNAGKKLVKKEPNVSLDLDNNELLNKNYILNDSSSIKFRTTYIQENISKSLTPTQAVKKDINLNERTLTGDQQSNKLLKVPIKKRSPLLITEKSPKINQYDTNKDKIENNLNSYRRKLPTNKQTLSVKTSSDKEQKATLVINKVTASKTENVLMEAASPIKNVFYKQNFTEQSIQENVLIRKTNTIKPLTQILQSKAKPVVISRQRKASIDVMQQTPLNNESLELNRTARKKQVLERMSQIRKRITKIIDKENVVDLQPKTSRSKNKVEITNVTILPMVESPNVNSTQMDSTNKHFDAFIKPMVKAKERNLKIKKSKNEAKPSVNPTEGPSKKQMHKNVDVVSCELTNLDLSESVLEFLQDDLHKNKLDINQLDSILEAAPVKTENITDANLLIENRDSSCSTIILEELLDQVDKEFNVVSNRSITEELILKSNLESPNVTKFEELNAENVCSDGYKTIHEEIKLLSKVGLTILKDPQCEVLPIKGEELLRLKAKQFADILKSTPSVWQLRRFKDLRTEQLNSSFLEMSAKINSIFKINLTSIDVKRIFNLVMSWYTKVSNGKWLDKKAVSANLQYYMQLFSFLPKTGRPIYNCEFCDQQYRSEAAYSIHRSTHTGGSAYSCFHCGKGFMKSSAQKIHERSHIAKKDENKYRRGTKSENNTDLKNDPKKRTENSKTNLKRAYSPEKSTTENSNPKRFQAAKVKSNKNISTIQLQKANDLDNNKMM